MLDHLTYVPTYDELLASAQEVLKGLDFTPDYGLVLGTSLGKLLDDMEILRTLDYSEIPHYLVSTVKSHEGKLHLGYLYGHKVACMSGRFHFYEGYDFRQLAIPPRFFKLLGCHSMILTNAAGAINAGYQVGDLMVIEDTIKLTGASPISGPNDERFGPRFIEVTNLFDQAWAQQVQAIAKSLSIPCHKGVYFFAGGPQFETAAEIRAMRILGADAVGMSTVPEAIAGHHCGLRVLGISLMTNMATGVVQGPVDTASVSDVGRESSSYFKRLLEAVFQADRA